MQKVLKKSEPELKQAGITALSTMDNPYPSVLLTDHTQRDDPDVGETGRHQQAR
jgi:hypothetical protein